MKDNITQDVQTTLIRLNEIKDNKQSFYKEVVPYTQLILDLTIDFPNNTSLKNRVTALAQDKDCKCIICGKVHGNPNRETCTEICYRKTTKYKEEKQKLIIEKGEFKFLNLNEGYDYLVCKICGCKVGEITQSHLNSHDYTISQYKQEFNVTSIKPLIASDRIKGNLNPAYQHGGKYSPFSKNFIYADTTNIEELKTECRNTMLKNNSSNTTIQYWLKFTNGDVDKAQLLLNERQATFSLEKCIKRYGQEKGLEVWSARQYKWQSSLNEKTIEELNEINRKKSNQKTHYKFLWKNSIDAKGTFYVLLLENSNIKIGITTNTIKHRYGTSKYIIIKEYKFPIALCFQVEQLIKKQLKEFAIKKENAVKDFGWTETFTASSKDIILNIANMYFDNFDIITKDFKNTFNLKYDSNF